MNVDKSSRFISLDVKGIEELKRELRALPAKLQRNVLRGAVRAGAVVIANEAKRLAPRRTGQLAESVRVSTRAKPGIVSATVKIGDRFRVFSQGAPIKGAAYRTKRPGGGYHYHAAFYAHFVEFGTKPHIIKGRRRNWLFVGGIFRRKVNHPGARPKPFLGPAARNKSQQAIDTMLEYARVRIAKIDQGSNGNG